MTSCTVNNGRSVAVGGNQNHPHFSLKVVMFADCPLLTAHRNGAAGIVLQR
jgi:hypothetical protein